MPRLNGWQFLILVAMCLATPVVLIALGQQLSAIVAAGLAIAGALAGVIAQNAMQAQRSSRIEANTNGANAELVKQIAELNKQMVELAKLVPVPTEVNNRDG